MLTKQKVKDFFMSSIKNPLLMTCVFLTFFYLLSGYFKWLEIVVSIGAIVAMLIFPIQKAFCIFLYLHNFTLSDIKYNFGFTITFIAFASILCLKYIIGLFRKKYKFYPGIFLIFALILTISLIVSINKPIYSGALVFIAYIPLFYFMFAMHKEFILKQCIRYLLLGFIVSSFFAVIAIFLPNYQLNPIMDGRFIAFTDNPNYLYMRAIFILTYYMYRFLNRTLSNKKFYLYLKFVLIYIFCAVIILSTLSKTGICMLVLLTFIFCILYLKDNTKKRLKAIGIFLLIILVVGVAGYKFVFEIVERFFEIRNGDVIGSILTGRDDIWADYLRACGESHFTLLFGHGLITEQVFITAQNQPRASHNLYIFMLYRFGIVGIVLFVIAIALMVKNLNKQKINIFASIPLIWFLIESFCDNTFKVFNIIYIVLVAMILFDDTEGETKIPITSSKAKTNTDTKQKS